MIFPRRSGILLHPTSLPGAFGIGDLGSEAYRFVDFLVSAHQTYWQMLPLSPTGYADSPYQGLSAFAGNSLLISPDGLVLSGFLDTSNLGGFPPFPTDRVDFGRVISHKTDLLQRAFVNFKSRATPAQRDSFDRFDRENASWLDDYALFVALKETHNLRPWDEWEDGLMRRQPEELTRARHSLVENIEKVKFLQWQFFEQWLALKKYANERGIRIVGDVPIYVARDCADVWTNPHLFHLDEDLRSVVVSGVPPDYFSATGQLWGHPIYRWDVLQRDGYAWWIARFRAMFNLADVIRIDHFRGFYNYWQVPASESTAVKGEWIMGPGAELFREVSKTLGQVAIIAEDLGDFNPESRAGVDAIQHEFGFPGMKVLQFAFGAGPQDPFLPHNTTRDYVVYTGTHDNDTTLGWYQETSTEQERDYARRYMHTDATDITWDLIRLAWSSVANTAITTAQDLLGLGHAARMNTPSTVGEPNWCWRLTSNALTNEIAGRLADLTWVYGRTP